MTTAYVISLFTCLLFSVNLIHADEFIRSGQYEEEAAIVKKCLTDKAGNMARSDLEKVAYFSKWNQSEEIVCFTHCLSYHKGWFDVSAGRWIRHKLVADLGDDMFKYCENELMGGFESVCDFVYKGFRCLRDAANNIAETYKTLLICANELHVSDVAELQKYGTFPRDEHIPCLFNCAAEKLNLYDDHFQWNLDNWVKAFGPLKFTAEDVDYSICRAGEEERNQEDQKCTWMYREYLCLKDFNEDQHESDTATTPTSTTLSTSTELPTEEVSPSELLMDETTPKDVTPSESKLISKFKAINDQADENELNVTNQI